ncbi:MAG: (Fe-S)-binding protein [Raoultibacter sp.]
MDDQVFVDVLTENVMVFDGSFYKQQEINRDDAENRCASLFFPGCSFLNFAPHLMQKVYNRLFVTGAVDGISLVCCGKMLSFEPDADTVRPAFEKQLIFSVLEHGVERIVAACPNCVETLREVLQADPDAAKIEVVALPQALLEGGLRIDSEALARRDKAAAVFAVHDSCPDKTMGEFASSVRALFPQESLVETKHNRTSSFCCGSLARAAGNEKAAYHASMRHGEEACQAGASVLVTSCLSCAHQLATAQSDVSVCHYLELLFNEEIDWLNMPEYMKTRFLFEELHGVRDYRGTVDVRGDDGL